MEKDKEIPGKYWIFEIDLPRAITIWCKLDKKKTCDKLFLYITGTNEQALAYAKKFVRDEIEMVDTAPTVWGASTFEQKRMDFVNDKTIRALNLTVGSYPTFKFYKDPVNYEAGIQPALPVNNYYNSPRYFADEMQGYYD